MVELHTDSHPRRRQSDQQRAEAPGASRERVRGGPWERGPGKGRPGGAEQRQDMV